MTVSVFRSTDSSHQQVIISRPHNNLLRPALDSSGVVEIIGNDLPEALLSLRLPQLEQSAVFFQQNFSGNFSPDIYRKAFLIDPVQGKIPEKGRTLLLPFLCLYSLQISQLIQLPDISGKISLPGHAVQVSLRGQLSVRQIHRAAAH